VYLQAPAEERYRCHVEKLKPGRRDVLGVKWEHSDDCKTITRVKEA
jgi:hypothetical protein